MEENGEEVLGFFFLLMNRVSCFFSFSFFL